MLKIGTTISATLALAALTAFTNAPSFAGTFGLSSGSYVAMTTSGDASGVSNPNVTTDPSYVPSEGIICVADAGVVPGGTSNVPSSKVSGGYAISAGESGTPTGPATVTFVQMGTDGMWAGSSGSAGATTSYEPSSQPQSAAPSSTPSSSASGTATSSTTTTVNSTDPRLPSGTTTEYKGSVRLWEQTQNSSYAWCVGGFVNVDTYNFDKVTLQMGYGSAQTNAYESVSVSASTNASATGSALFSAVASGG